MSVTHQISQRYYRWLNRLFRMDKYARLIPIDFNQPWWHLYKKQWGSIAIVAVLETCNNVFLSMPALILEYFLLRGTAYFGYFVLLWGIILLLELVADFHSTRVMVQCLQSINYAANQHLLQVDPIFHQSSTKGKVLAKIYRGSEAFQEIFRAAIYEILSLIIGVVTVIVSFLTIDIRLGLLALVLLSILTLVSVGLFLFSAKVLVPLRIDADDRVKNVGTESLMQATLIRSTFSAHHVNAKLQQVNKQRLSIEGNSLRSYDIISSLSKIAYVGIFAFIGIFVINLVTSNTISQTTGIALLVTFFSGTYQLLVVGQFIYRFKDQLIRAHDLVAFMRSYGQQTFPVMYLPPAQELTVKKNIIKKSLALCLEACNIKFRYGQNNPLFNGHKVRLVVPREQESKLYGIIGYSGQGKSTLLSILGGQLKPSAGNVFINQINIYAINDEVRRSLLALQNQNSAGFYGSIRYNLTFGIARGCHYTNQELIEVLERLGLWEVLQQKRGLETKVSEGGLALSSGQRQRLDFASVYLRARCYKPAFVLLDEPTSNLDEENERAVSAMIQELATDAVVLVVSHRLKTLEKTQGILDLSLAHTTKELAFIQPEQLAQQSFYYQQLLTGNVSFALSKKSDTASIPENFSQENFSHLDTIV